ANSNAVGGTGGSGHTNGLGGAAKSTSTATSTGASSGTAQSYAYATGGLTGGGSTTRAKATATANATAANGNLAQAYTSSNGGGATPGTGKGTATTSGTVSTGGSTLKINSLKSIASAPTSSAVTTLSRSVNGTAYGVDSSYNAEAYGGGGAKFGGLGPNVGAVFNASSTFVLGSGALGATANGAASLTYSTSVEWNVNTSTLPSGAGHNLDVGLVSPLTSGTGFTSLTFSVTEDSVVKLTQTFATVAAANTFFTDDLQNLGQWTSGSTLDVLVSMTEKLTGTGNGYGVNFMVGVDPPPGRGFAPRAVPEPATISVFGLGLLGLGWSKLRGRKRRAG
ncbi:MAG: PEP-CTERM sorting domain-containing protein, partial [Acetobacteraceae bacterium]